VTAKKPPSLMATLACAPIISACLGRILLKYLGHRQVEAISK
jgi:hypothetical protein